MVVQMQYRGIKHVLNKNGSREERILVYRGAKYVRQAIQDPSNEKAANQTTKIESSRGIN